MDDSLRQRPDQNETDDGEDLSLDPAASGRSGSFRLFDHDIRDTTTAFNSKIQQKKKIQERTIDATERRQRIRQSYIVQAMVGMRKSLREVMRLDLGDRFNFVVTTDDWQGWPRVTLSVQDETVPDAEYPQFQIMGGFRDEKAQIDINLGDSENVLTYNLISEADLKKLSGLYKKSVRSYLDMIGDVILQAERAPVEKPIDQIVAAPVEMPTEAPRTDELDLSENLFEEGLEENLFEALPHLDSVDPIDLFSESSPGPKNRR